MKFVPVNEEIVPVTKIRSETQKLLLEFMESDLNSAEVVGYPHKTLKVVLHHSEQPLNDSVFMESSLAGRIAYS